MKPTPDNRNTCQLVSVLAVVLTFVWGVDAETANCGQNELSKSEISSCIDNGEECRTIGILSDRIQILDPVNKSTKPDTQRVSSLIYFEVVDPISVRFSGKGYKNLSLFEINEERVLTSFRCVENAETILSPGQYVLKSHRNVNPLGGGSSLLHLTIWTTDAFNTSENNKDAYIADDSEEVFAKSMRAGIRMGLISLGVSVVILILVILGP